MKEFDDMQSKFCNQRQWRDFAAAVHESVSYPASVTYPKVISALRAGRARFNDGAARASNWLNGREESAGALVLDRA